MSLYIHRRPAKFPLPVGEGRGEGFLIKKRADLKVGPYVIATSFAPGRTRGLSPLPHKDVGGGQG